ncbi:MAG: hypothetical protein H0X67_00100 [Acidobacteria bacterium]|nr:hypothetical protein [Acidobacteriota bacterium]
MQRGRRSSPATDGFHDLALIENILKLMADGRVDYTIVWRRLSQFVAGGNAEPVRDLFAGGRRAGRPGRIGSLSERPPVVGAPEVYPGRRSGVRRLRDRAAAGAIIGGAGGGETTRNHPDCWRDQ